MFKKKCFICRTRDDKENMEEGSYGIYGDSKRYFHHECMETVICEPEMYDHRAVDRALWCQSNLTAKLRDENRRKRDRRERIQKAQETLECLK